MTKFCCTLRLGRRESKTNLNALLNLNKKRFTRIASGAFKRDDKSVKPGSFLVRNDALVIIDLETVTVFVAGDTAMLIPIGPSSV